jgi:hypothetical protein
MRRLTFAAFIALAFALASVAPAFAAGVDPGHPNAKINLWCSVVSGTQVNLNGNLVGDDNTSGHVTLTLLGSNNETSWHNTGQFVQIPLVKGQSTYWFSFTAQMDSSHYLDYLVSGFDTKSRIVNWDECGFRVPEAPSSALLLLGAFPAVGLLTIKATGVRLPLPSLRRIV